MPNDRADAESRFSIVSSARSKCHLHVLEAVYIRSLAPPLCVQKEFVRVLQLFLIMVIFGNCRCDSLIVGDAEIFLLHTF